MMDGRSDAPITYALQGDVALIALNRPEKRNAISDHLVEALHAAIQCAQAEARAAVIHGIGAHFCTGLDLAEHSEEPLIAAVLGSRRWHRIFDGIERGAIPFVCAMLGAVMAGGFELAAATHLRVADGTALPGLPEGDRGIFAGGGGSVRIARLIGAQRMVDMMPTGQTVGPDQMEQWGGVSDVVPEGEALARAIELARAAATNAPISNDAILNALPCICDMSSEDGLFVESLMSSLTSVTPEAKDRLRAFLEKRTERLQSPKE